MNFNEFVKNLTIGEKSTNIKTNICENIPDFYSIDDIIEKTKIDLNREIENSDEYFFLRTKGKKKGRKNQIEILINNKEEEENSNKKKRWRKTSRNSNIVHDKNVGDNIMKKIKCQLFKYIIPFFNELLKIFNIKLLKLDYKYIRKLNHSYELKLFECKLKDLLSLYISPKYKDKNLNNDYNKKIIDNFINKENKENENIFNKNKKIYDTLIFLFNLTYRDWSNLMTEKTNFEELAQNNNVDNIDFEIINNNFVGINKLLNNLKIEECEEYYSHFIFLFFNYERWFSLKHLRKKNKK